MNNSGFEMVDLWSVFMPGCRSAQFEPERLYALPNYRPEFDEINLLIIEIGEPCYHAFLLDYSEGYSKSFGEGTYLYDVDKRRNWSDYERAVTDLMERIDSGEIDLGSELEKYVEHKNNICKK